MNDNLSPHWKTSHTTKVFAEILARDGNGLSNNEPMQINNFTGRGDRPVGTIQLASHSTSAPEKKPTNRFRMTISRARFSCSLCTSSCNSRACTRRKKEGRTTPHQPTNARPQRHIQAAHVPSQQSKTRSRPHDSSSVPSATPSPPPEVPPAVALATPTLASLPRPCSTSGAPQRRPSRPSPSRSRLREPCARASSGSESSTRG